jgi:hypothetical protein
LATVLACAAGTGHNSVNAASSANICAGRFAELSVIVKPIAGPHTGSADPVTFA